MSSRRWLVLGALPIAAFLSGCGGGSSLEKVDVDDWLDDVCAEAIDFDEELSSSGDALFESDPEDPDEVKAAIDEIVENGKKIVEDFVEAVEEIGQPDIDRGDKVVQAIRDHAKEITDQMDDLRDEVNKLDEDDDDFADQIIELLADQDDPDFKRKLRDIESADVDDLIDEIEDDDECAAVLFD